MQKENTQRLLNDFEELDILNVSASGKLNKETLSAAIDLTKDAYQALDFSAIAKRIEQNVGKYTRA